MAESMYHKQLAADRLIEIERQDKRIADLERDLMQIHLDYHPRIADLEADRDDLTRLLGRDPSEGRTVTEHAQDVMDINARLHEEVERLRAALRDAIRRPLGVVPASAEGLISEGGSDGG